MADQQRDSSTPNVIAGVDRSHGSTHLQKVVFCGLHLISVVLCLWLVFGGGVTTVGEWFGKTWTVTEPVRAGLVVGAAALYWGRHAITLFYLLVRRVTWSEGFGLVSAMLPMEMGLCLLAAGLLRTQAAPWGVVDGLAIVLVLSGSFLNTGSEVQRKWWKNDPANKGHCYTGGLFRYSMHINYFGDCLMFTGWCLLTAWWWSLVLPFLMTALFVFYHIPGLDRYLEERYGEEFRVYAGRTKKLIPFIY